MWIKRPNGKALLALVLILSSSPLLVLSPSASSQPPTFDWPTFHYDLGNTGFSPSPAPNTSNLLWKYKTGHEVWSSPAVANGRVFVASWDWHVYCLDESTGALKWNYETGGYVDSSPAVVDGKVFVGSNDHNIYCFGPGAPVTTPPPTTAPPPTTTPPPTTAPPPTGPNWLLIGAVAAIIIVIVAIFFLLRR